MTRKLSFASAVAGNEPPGRKRLMAAALLGVCSLAFLTSACGAEETAGKNHGASSSPERLPQGGERVKLNPAGRVAAAARS